MLPLCIARKGLISRFTTSLILSISRFDTKTPTKKINYISLINIIDSVGDSSEGAVKPSDLLVRRISMILSAIVNTASKASSEKIHLSLRKMPKE